MLLKACHLTITFLKGASHQSPFRLKIPPNFFFEFATRRIERTNNKDQPEGYCWTSFDDLMESLGLALVPDVTDRPADPFLDMTDRFSVERKL